MVPVEMKIEGETKTLTEAMWSPPMASCTTSSARKATLMETVASVLLDSVPDKTDDLVLGEAGGLQHVAK